MLMKKLILIFIVVMLTIFSFTFIACGSDNKEIDYFYKETTVKTISQVPNPIAEKQIGDIYYRQYNIGSIKNFHVENVTVPFVYSSGMKEYTFKKSITNSTSISKGLERSISTAKSVTVSYSTSETIGWSFDTSISATASAKVGVDLGFVSDEAKLSKTFEIAAGEYGSTTTTTSSEISKQVVEAINESSSTTFITEEIDTYEMTIDTTGFEEDKHYALALIANIEVYQVIAQNLKTGEFSFTYFVSSLNNSNSWIKLVKSDTNDFDIETDKQLHPITEVPKISKNITPPAEDGSTENPYTISCAEDLSKLRANANKNFILTLDIDLLLQTWTPIPEFSGTLNGNGHKISNFKIESSESNVGFINNNSGKIFDLKFSNVTVNSSNTTGVVVGALVGTNKASGILQNCSVEDSEICGYAKETTNHNSDHSIAAIVGGVAGKNSGTLIGCKVVGSTVKGESQRWDGNDCGGSGDIAIAYVGGIVGEITSGGKIKDCNANEMTLIKGYGYFRFWFMNNSKPHITVYAGGVVGCLDEGANIETCASDLTNDSFELQASYGKKNDGWGSEDTYCTAMKGSVIGNNM